MTEETFAEQRDLILWPFLEKAEQSVDELSKYILHVGITPRDIDATGRTEEAILAHYRTRKGFDIDRAAHDLLTYPPIAARVRELRRQRQYRRDQRNASKQRAKRGADG